MSPGQTQELNGCWSASSIPADRGLASGRLLEAARRAIPPHANARTQGFDAPQRRICRAPAAGASQRPPAAACRDQVQHRQPAEQPPAIRVRWLGAEAAWKSCALTSRSTALDLNRCRCRSRLREPRFHGSGQYLRSSTQTHVNKLGQSKGFIRSLLSIVRPAPTRRSRLLTTPGATPSRPGCHEAACRTRPPAGRGPMVASLSPAPVSRPSDARVPRASHRPRPR